MGTLILSLDPLVDELAPAFTQPSLASAGELLLAWVLCRGKPTPFRVAPTAHPDKVPDHSRRHGLDGYSNFFARSAWTVKGLAYRLAVLLLTRLKLCERSTLRVDDTLAPKRGHSVWGLGWFRAAVASTHQRVATASGPNGVVVAGAVCRPFTGVPLLALPLRARLHLPGKGQPRGADWAHQMLAEVLRCWGCGPSKWSWCGTRWG